MTRNQLITLLRSTAASQETLHHVMHVWKDVDYRQILPLEKIVEMCAHVVGSTVADMVSKNRSRAHVRGRMLFIFYVHKYQYGKFSLKKMAECIGNRDHTTIIYLREKAYDLVETQDEVFMTDLSELERLVLAGDFETPPHPFTPVPIVNIKTNKVYNSIGAAAKVNHMSKATFSGRLRFAPNDRFPFARLVAK